MTMPSSVSRVRYEGNGTATQFPFSFKVWETSQLAVTLTGPDGKSSDAAGWTASLDESGGTVTYLHDGSPLPEGWLLAITRDMPFTQEIDLVSATRFDPAVMEDGLDMATAERQQLREQLSRSVILPPTSDKSPQEMADRLLDAEKNAINAAQKAETEAATATEQAGRAEAEADEATRQAADAADAARRAQAWAESPTPPDPDDPESKSAKEWARIASDTVPLATASLPGKACFPAPFTVGENGAVGIREAGDRQSGICRLATAEEVAAATAPESVALPGSALSRTPQAGKIPVYDAGGKLPVPGIPSQLYNNRLVLTGSNASWLPPVTGWARVTVIGGGGAGGAGGVTGGAGGLGGAQGGTTVFGNLSAIGGSGGGGGGGSPYGNSGGGGGGGAGAVTTAFVYLNMSVPVYVAIGAGAAATMASTGNNYGANGAGPSAGRGGVYQSAGSGAAGASSGCCSATDSYPGAGGAGGLNGTGYGGGGGGGGGVRNEWVGAVGAAAEGGAYGNWAWGGNGGYGAVIIEYYKETA